jgi:uncharacterized protein (TIGR00369 family)
MQPQDPEFESRVRESLARQAYMNLLGVTLTRIEPGQVHLGFPVRGELLQQHGTVHAGALASAMDSAAGYAAFTLMPAGSGVVSVEFKVNLLEPARGERIEARARVVRAGRTLTSVAAEAWALEGTREQLVATFSGTMMCLVGRSVTG